MSTHMKEAKKQPNGHSDDRLPELEKKIEKLKNDQDELTMFWSIEEEKMRDMGKLVNALFDESHCREDQQHEPIEAKKSGTISVKKLTEENDASENKGPEGAEDFAKKIKEANKEHINAVIQSKENVKQQAEEEGDEVDKDQADELRADLSVNNNDDNAEIIEAGTSEWFEKQRTNQFFKKAITMMGEPLDLPEFDIAELASNNSDAMMGAPLVIQTDTPTLPKLGVKSLLSELTPIPEKRLLSTDPNLQKMFDFASEMKKQGSWVNKVRQTQLFTMQQALLNKQMVEHSEELQKRL